MVIPFFARFDHSLAYILAAFKSNGWIGKVCIIFSTNAPLVSRLFSESARQTPCKRSETVTTLIPKGSFSCLRQVSRLHATRARGQQGRSCLILRPFVFLRHMGLMFMGFPDVLFESFCLIAERRKRLHQSRQVSKG